MEKDLPRKPYTSEYAMLRRRVFEWKHPLASIRKGKLYMPIGGFMVVLPLLFVLIFLALGSWFL